VQEIGPGLGALTRALLAAGHSVEALEIDQGLISFLKEDFKNESRFKLVEGDALKILPSQPPRKILCGNLPYSISTPLLVQLALRQPPPETVVVTLQKEVADRFAAPPRTSCCRPSFKSKRFAPSRRRCFIPAPASTQPSCA
jgi:16S rRNA (adenine1518-N6/adenine1519-N6)-dimethyltransferase